MSNFLTLFAAAVFGQTDSPATSSAPEAASEAIFEAAREAPAVRLWTLAECQQYAVEHSPSTRVAAFTNRRYNQDVIAAAGALTPSVSAGMGADWGFGRSIDPSTNTYDDLSNFNNRYSIQAQMVIFGGFSGVNTLRASRLAMLGGRQELQKARDDASLATLKAFVDVVYCTEAQRLALEQLDESRRNLHSTRRQVELGLKSMPDVAQFEAEVAGFEFTLTKQQNALTTSVLQLKTVMNFPLGEALEIDPALPVDRIGTPPDAAQDPAAQDPAANESAAAIFEGARGNLPAAQIADYKLRNSRLQLAIARGAYLPSVSAYGSLGSNYFKNLTSADPTAGFRSQLRNNYGSSVGLSVSIPIFDGLWQRTRVNRAKNDYRIAQETHDETLRQIRTEIEQAVMDVEGGAREWIQAVRKVAATEAAHRANRRKFDEGLLSALELQNSTNLLLGARVEELNSRLQYSVKCWLLDFYKSYEK